MVYIALIAKELSTLSDGLGKVLDGLGKVLDDLDKGLDDLHITMEHCHICINLTSRFSHENQQKVHLPLENNLQKAKIIFILSIAKSQ